MVVPAGPLVAGLSVNCNGSGFRSVSMVGDDSTLEPRLWVAPLAGLGDNRPPGVRERRPPPTLVGDRRPLTEVGDNLPPRSANIFCSNGDLNLLVMPAVGEPLLCSGDLVLEPIRLLGNGDLVFAGTLLLGPLLRGVAGVPLLTVDGAWMVVAMGDEALW